MLCPECRPVFSQELPGTTVLLLLVTHREFSLQASNDALARRNHESTRKMCRVVCRRSMSRDAASLLPASIPCNIKLRLRDASGYCQQRPRILSNYIAELDLFREHNVHLAQQCSAFLSNPSPNPTTKKSNFEACFSPLNELYLVLQSP